MYGYLIQIKADYTEEEDYQLARRMRQRAAKLYLRGRNYVVRGLEVEYPGFLDSLQHDAVRSVASMEIADVPYLYWIGASWALAISISTSDLNLVAELHLVEPIMIKALELDPSWDDGSIHEFFITFDGGRSAAMGGSTVRAREHFEKALDISKGLKASPYVSLAESVSTQEQNAAEYTQMLNMALLVDPDATPESRLLNIITQRRARWLLDHIDDYFLLPDDDSSYE